MISQRARKIFEEYPIIAAVRTPEDFECALESKVKVFFMVGGDVFKARKQIGELKARGDLLFFHMDLIEGLGKDPSGIRHAKEEFGVDGVQSTKPHILKIAKHEKLITVHRLFVTDFQSLQSGLNLAKMSKPDFLELTPGIIPKIVKMVKAEQSLPIISSGLVSTIEDVKDLISAGTSNICCSTRTLWNISYS
ncbi:MAG: glycerol-3-phosphate responsive antiterminator [Christensenellales bacterium]|jgi:glycerol uptake operon antiterminator